MQDYINPSRFYSPIEDQLMQDYINPSRFYSPIKHQLMQIIFTNRDVSTHTDYINPSRFYSPIQNVSTRADCRLYLPIEMYQLVQIVFTNTNCINSF